MPTETDLRSVLFRLETDALSVDEVLESLASRLERRRRGPGRALAAMAAAAAIIAVVAVIAALVPDGSQGHRESSARPAPLSRAQLVPAWHFSVSAVPGFRVVRDTFIRPDTSTWVQEGALVTARSGRVTGRITVQEHSPGGFEAQLAQTITTTAPHRLRVSGRPGYFLAGTPLTAVADDPWAAAVGDPDSQPQLVWQLPDGAWAMVEGTFGFQPVSRTWDDGAAQRAMSRLAGAVRYTRRSPVQLPFRLARDPAGVVPATVRLFPDSGAYCLGYAARRPGAPSFDGKGAALLVCRSATPTGHGRFRALVVNDATFAARTLPDGSTLRVVGLRTVSPISSKQAAALLRAADTSPALARPSTWLTVH